MPVAGNYLIRVSGFGRIQEDVWTEVFDFTTDDGGFDGMQGSNNPSPYTFDARYAQWLSGVGWTDSNVLNFEHVAYIGKTFSSTFIRSVTMESLSTPEWAHGIEVGSPIFNGLIQFTPDIVNPLTRYPNGNATLIFLLIQKTELNSGQRIFPNAITKCTVTGTGTNNLGSAVAKPRYGDAAYEWTEGETPTRYGGQGGLNIDGLGIPALQALDYSSNHVYEFEYTHGGGTMDFSYTDPVNNYADNENKYLKVELIGPL